MNIATVNPYGFDMTCSYHYEPACGDGWNEPLYPESVSLTTCFVGDVDIYSMLSPNQIERIEDCLLRQVEEL